ncbi:MAG: hypothetical protein ACRYG4_04320 [Janthinobacterium lividum]
MTSVNLSIQPALSVRERHAVEAIRDHYHRLGRPPSYKEIGAVLGVGAAQAHALVKGATDAGKLFLWRREGHRTEIRLLNPIAELATSELVAEMLARSTVPANDLIRAHEYKPKDTVLLAVA